MTEHKHDHEPQAIRAQALESLLIEKGLLTADAIDDVITQYNERVGPLNGARVVARAWTNPDFKRQLLAEGTSESTAEPASLVVKGAKRTRPEGESGLIHS